MSNKAVGGGNFHYSSSPVQSGQIGVEGGTGYNNIGLLVKVWGIATQTDANDFTVSDGSNVVVNVMRLSAAFHQPASTSV